MTFNLGPVSWTSQFYSSNFTFYLYLFLRTCFSARGAPGGFRSKGVDKRS